MIKYITNSEFREAYKFLNSNSFLQSGYKFQMIGFQEIRDLLDELLDLKNFNFFINCFKILEQNKNKPNQMMKVLMLIHFILQTSSQKSQEILQILIHQINVIIQNSRKYCVKQHLQNPGSVKFFNQITYKSKNQKHVTQSKNTSIQIFKKSLGNFFQTSRESQNQESVQCTKKQAEKKNMQQNYQVSSPKQVLCQKFIEPYARYLLKQCSNSNRRGEQESSDFFLWTQINKFKLIFKISEGISILSRYYEVEYFETVMNLIQILNEDIQKSYMNLKTKIEEKIQKIKKKQLIPNLNIKRRDNIYEMKNKRVLSQAQISNQQLSQIKQLLKQLSEIHESMVNIYCGKYVVHELKERCIKMPTVMKLQSPQFQKIFQIISQNEKVIERNKKVIEERNAKPATKGLVILNQFRRFKNKSGNIDQLCGKKGVKINNSMNISIEQNISLQQKEFR